MREHTSRLSLNGLYTLAKLSDNKEAINPGKQHFESCPWWQGSIGCAEINSRLNSQVHP
jgi:hypothetical protein